MKYLTLSLLLLFSCKTNGISYDAGKVHVDTIWDKSGCTPLYEVKVRGDGEYKVEITEDGRVIIRDSQNCITGYINRDSWNRVKDEYDTINPIKKDTTPITNGNSVIMPVGVGIIELNYSDSGILELNYPSSRDVSHPVITKHYTYYDSAGNLIEEPLGGESGFLNSKAYKDAARAWERDTISASELDGSQTFTDQRHEFIIYKGEVFFRADVVGEEKRAKEVLDRFNEMAKRANEKINTK